MKRFSVLLLGLTVFAGCNTSTPNPAANVPVVANSPDPVNSTGLNIDGNWRYQGSGSIPTACVTVQGSRVTTIDENCDGTNLTFASQPGGLVSSQGITLGAVYRISPTDDNNYGIYAYYLKAQPDGSLTGQAVLSIEPGNNTFYADVQWIKQ